jgi:hypothetical protein
VVSLQLPGGVLQTVLCAACMPQPKAGRLPELCLTLVAADPILPVPVHPTQPRRKGLRLIRASELKTPELPSPPPDQVARRTCTGPLTFPELCEMEPRLLDLLAEAHSHHNNHDEVFCANAVWYGYPGYKPGIRARMCRLVGIFAEKAGDLRPPEAYDLAYQTIYKALPDCRGNCICTRILENM